MKKLILTIIILFPILVLSQTHIPGGSVSGVWEISGSPYLIEGDITVDSAQTLEIKPGVRVEFQGYYGLTVNGTIKSIGQIDSMITFTINDTTGISDLDNDTSGAWSGITIEENIIDTSFIIFSIIKYTKYSYAKAVWVSGNIVFSNNIILNNYSSLSPVSSTLTLRNSSKAKVYNNFFFNNIYCFKEKK